MERVSLQYVRRCGVPCAIASKTACARTSMQSVNAEYLGWSCSACRRLRSLCVFQLGEEHCMPWCMLAGRDVQDALKLQGADTRAVRYNDPWFQILQVLLDEINPCHVRCSEEWAPTVHVH
jgi:hypothetical protein